MKPPKCEGIWWLPDSPENEVVGRLRIERGGRTSLSLIGTLGSPGHIFGSVDRPLILGRLHNCRLGSFATLTRCRVKSQTIGTPEFRREKYYVDRVFLGDEHLLAPKDFLFSRATIRFSGLASWARELRGMAGGLPERDKEHGWVWRFTYITPPSTPVDVPGGELTLRATGSASQTSRAYEFKERLRLHLRLKVPMTEPELGRKFVYPLQNFLTLATDHPNAQTEFRLGHAAQDAEQSLPSREFHVIGPLIFTDDQSAKDLGPGDMIFELSNVADRFADVLRRWLEVSEKYEAACNIYFGTQYAPPQYVDLKFQTVAQALSLYQSRREGAPPWQEWIPVLGEALPRLTPEESQWLLKQVASNPLTVADWSLKTLLSEHRRFIEPLTGHRTDRFAAAVLDNLAYVLHRDERLGPSDQFGTTTYYLTQGLAFLMKACFLKELGFSEDERERMLTGNKMYEHVREGIGKRLA